VQIAEWMIVAVIKPFQWNAAMSAVVGFVQYPTPAPPSRFTAYQMLC